MRSALSSSELFWLLAWCALGLKLSYVSPHNIAGSAAEIAQISVVVPSSCDDDVVALWIAIAVSWLEVELADKLLLLFSVLLVFMLLTMSKFERPWWRGDKENMLLHLRLAIVVKL